MIYIFCAFETEARALIDVYKLVKIKTSPYSVYSNEAIELTVFGMGQEKAREACQNFLSQTRPAHDDVFINIGICAAQEGYKIGELVQIKSICDKNKYYELLPRSSAIRQVSCFSASAPLNEPTQTDIAEMESLALFETFKEQFQPENISFLKIVSDNFQPFVPKKKFVIELIQTNIKEIRTHIKHLQGKKHAD